MNDTIPCVASVVDDDVDLAASEFSGLLDELRNVRVVENIASDRNCCAAALLDLVRYSLCFLWD